LVEILGEIFRAFDDLCNTHRVTKIKTIGDAYMAATGAPEAAAGGATAAIHFSENAIEVVASISLRTGIPISIRVGVATGAAISGVLTLKRPAYDLWGETVNLASRLEGTSAPGRIHIAETTYWRVKQTFNCEARGMIDVKGIGPIATYFVSEHSDSHKNVQPNWILPIA
jgi:class 3 adenylate cyclase